MIELVSGNIIACVAIYLFLCEPRDRMIAISAIKTRHLVLLGLLFILGSLVPEVFLAFHSLLLTRLARSITFFPSVLCLSSIIVSLGFCCYIKSQIRYK